jgi:hypothetical protein
MKHSIEVLLAALGIAIGVVGVVALRAATLTTHEKFAPDSRMEVVVAGHIKGEAGKRLDETVEAQIQGCRLQVGSRVLGKVEPEGDGRYRAVLAPSMDRANRRKFRGCLHDWRIDRFRLDVIRLTELAANTG